MGKVRCWSAFASCLINLLCRQVGVLSRIEIIAPDTPTLICMPGSPNSPSFPSCLMRISHWAVNGAVTVSGRLKAATADYTIALGAGLDLESSRANLLILGDGWRAWRANSNMRHKECYPAQKSWAFFLRRPLLQAKFSSGAAGFCAAAISCL